MAYTVGQIATALGGVVSGDSDLVITGAAEPQDASPSDIALAMSAKYAEGLSKGAAQAAILWDGADWQALGLKAAIVVPRPRYAMSGLTKLLDPGPQIAPGIHPSAIIDDTARIGADAAIGPFVVVEAGAQIGSRARIGPQVHIAANTVIGDDALILSGAKLGHSLQIGDRFICHPNAVIGADGFSFVTPEKSGVEEIRDGTVGARNAIHAQTWTRIHSIGPVEIGDDVEIGANATIDRGTIRATRIGRGTKIDNLVQLGHNVVVGEDCLLCSQTGVSGSTRIGNRVVLGGKVGVSDNIFVGDDVIAGGGTNIYTNAPAGRVLLGSPALKMEQQVELNKNLRRLPRLFRDVAALKKAVPNAPSDD